MSEPITIDFLTRDGCGLCDSAFATLQTTLAERFEDAAAAGQIVIRVRDIDTDPELQAQYDYDVPVVLLNGRRHSFHRVDPDRLQRALHALLPGPHDS